MPTGDPGDWNMGMNITDWNTPSDYYGYYRSGCCNHVCFCTGQCNQRGCGSNFDFAAYLELAKKLDTILEEIRNANKAQT